MMIVPEILKKVSGSRIAIKDLFHTGKKERHWDFSHNLTSDSGTHSNGPRSSSTAHGIGSWEKRHFL